jgi:phosphonate transport system substrate-binding protein
VDLRILFFLTCTILFTNSLFALTLRYAPLPMYKSELVLKQYKGLLEYLTKQTGYTFEFVYHADYAQLLDAIAQKKVDIAHLGPLPYAALLQKNTDAKPIVQFLDNSAQASYTCSFITHERNYSQVQPYEPIALTQPLSTCGYLSISHLLQKKGIDLKNTDYGYSGTHSHVVLDIILGDAKSGGVRTSEYEAYKHLGLKQIDKTEAFPGFLWVASGTLGDEHVQKIQEALLKLDPFNNETHAKMMQNWGSNVKYGAIKAQNKDYEPIVKILQTTDIPELR